MNKHDSHDKEFQRIRQTSYRPQPVPTLEQKQLKEPKTWKSKLKWITITLLLLFIAFIVIFITWNLRNFSYAGEVLFDEPNALRMFPRKPLKTDSAGRTNILVIGSANDRENHGGADLTDTMLLVSLDPKDQSYMLSIPRDLYTAIPDYGTAKINEAFQFGERSDFTSSGYSGGGPGILEYLISDNFGIDVHYYVIVNFSAVEQIVDALGGITVVIDSPDERGLYDPNFQPEEGGPLRLENGEHTIDGQTALRLTRARGSAGGYGFPQSDFNRTQNQQKVIVGIIEALEPRDIIDPRSNKLFFDTAADNIETNLRINEVIPMGQLFLAVDASSIASHTLRDLNGENYLASYTTPSGLSALIPTAGIDNFSDIQAAIEQLHE